MTSPDVARAATGTPLAEVAWADGQGGGSAVVLVPLVDDGTVTFALPYSERTTAESIAAAGLVVVVCSDSRLALRGWEPVAALGSVRLVEDRDGERVRSALLEQELRKHPPARLLADSLVAQREHWWYLPRLLLRIEVVAAWSVGARTASAEGTLFGSAGADPTGSRPAATVEVVADEGDRLVLASLDGGELPAPGPSTLLRHDCSIPDMEQRSALVQRGRLEGATLLVADVEGDLALPEPAGLLTRYRRARAFERACRRQLAASR